MPRPPIKQPGASSPAQTRRKPSEELKAPADRESLPPSRPRPQPRDANTCSVSTTCRSISQRSHRLIVPKSTLLTSPVATKSLAPSVTSLPDAGCNRFPLDLGRGDSSLFHRWPSSPLWGFLTDCFLLSTQWGFWLVVFQPPIYHLLFGGINVNWYSRGGQKPQSPRT